jgi:hypothetical protein
VNTLRASALGSCLKAQAAGILGYEPMDVPEKMQVVFDRGHDHEAANDDALIAQFAIIDARQDEVILPISDDWDISGHLDGIIQLSAGATRRVWESKSPASWAKFRDAILTGDYSDLLAHRYAWQISVYMHATGLEAYVTCLPGWGKTIDEMAATGAVYGEDAVAGFGIEVPPFSIQEIRGRVEQIAGIVTSGQLPVACTSQDYPCPFAYLHESPPVDDDPAISKLVADYQFQDRMVKEWKGKMDATKARITDLLGDRETVTGDVGKVTRYTMTPADKIDRDAMKADGVYAKYATPGVATTAVKITPKKESE